MDATTSTIRVRQAPVPDEVRERSTLARLDYVDTFIVDGAPVGQRTAEQWMRCVLEDAPLRVRSRLISGWTALGLALHLGRPDTVLGWPVVRRTADLVLLGASSRVGMPGQLLLERTAGRLRFATLLEHRTAVTRTVWKGVEPTHVQTVCRLLEQAVEREVQAPAP